MTHKDLVKVAKEWLLSAKQCNPVFVEKGSAKVSEMPDAIGWNGSTGCIVVECKSNKADLIADKKKPFRVQGGMGNLRYFLMPAQLYKELGEFDFNGWGVVTIRENSSRAAQERFRASEYFPSNVENERNFLRSRIMEIQRFGK